MADDQQRLERVREYAHDALRYFATTYTRMGSAKVPDRMGKLSKEWGANFVLNEMTSLAHVIALLESAEDAREAMKRRRGIVGRYLREVEHDPWTPGRGHSGR